MEAIKTFGSTIKTLSEAAVRSNVPLLPCLQADWVRRKGTRIKLKLLGRPRRAAAHIRLPPDYEFSKTISRMLRPNETRPVDDETGTNEINKSPFPLSCWFLERRILVVQASHSLS